MTWKDFSKWGSVSVLALCTLAGCTKSGENTSGGAGGTVEVAAGGEGIAGAKPTGEMEVAAFKGGYGIDAYEKAAKEYEAANPGLKIKVAGDPRIWEALQPRLVASDAPDLMFPGWGMDHWALAQEGKLVELSATLKTPGPDGGIWADSFDPSILKLGQLDGKQYALPYYISLVGWWHNPDQFAKNGWTLPKTYGELLTLCEKIKAKGITPITYQGKYPYYMLDGMILPWIVSIGGQDALKACQNMEPGAWKSDAVVKAATMITELRDKGYLDADAVGLTHTEAQTDFVLGNAAMIPCGTWLEAEMANTTPKGTRIEYFLPPVVEGGKGDPTAIQVAIEPWMIPADAKNKEGGVGLFKYMTSKKVADEFIKAKGTLMSIKGTANFDLPASLQAPAKYYKASKDVWAVQYRNWYKEFEKEIENKLTELVQKKLTPLQFAEACEAAADKLRNDPEITKHKI